MDRKKIDNGIDNGGAVLVRSLSGDGLETIRQALKLAAAVEQREADIGGPYGRFHPKDVADEYRAKAERYRKVLSDLTPETDAS